ncbi:MAG TPA: class I SAM-dependent methyltransferase [Terriglobales bacterium]|nr:class I SAM-dependent methyltransferase [Terriglobales bacterium]
MNRLHHWLCRSAQWGKVVQDRIPWVLTDANLGSKVLELGPGPGLTTDSLRYRVEQLTALEVDRKLAESLRIRLHNTNVKVVTGDATAMPFPDTSFSAAISFAMLHHVPSAALQDRLLHEVRRVLQPGGVFVGSDTLETWLMRLLHVGDEFVPVNPDRFAARLTAAGFEVVQIEKNPYAFRFHAQRPKQS